MATDKRDDQAPRVPLSTRIDPEVRDALKLAAQLRGMRLYEAIEAAVNDWFDGFGEDERRRIEELRRLLRGGDE